jgi:hypothetical protein
MKKWMLVGYPASLEGLLQFLRYERAIFENHPSHDGRFLGPQAVAERHVRAAMHPTDPTQILVHRPDAGSLDYGGDALGRQVPIPSY